MTFDTSNIKSHSIQTDGLHHPQWRCQTFQAITAVQAACILPVFLILLFETELPHWLVLICNSLEIFTHFIFHLPPTAKHPHDTNRH
jgi:hypothetical protein